MATSESLYRLAHHAVSRVAGVPAPTHDYRVRRGVTIPMRDGVLLVADHYEPVGEPAGTLLVRSPYGRGFPIAPLYGAAYAARGHHVILQSVRGTFGSGGEFSPAVNEADDGQDTAAWLREQPWYTGSFGTIGPSYLAHTQFAMLEDPPEGLAASVAIVGVHDLAEATWGTGAFTVNDFLGWSHGLVHQEEPGRVRGAIRNLRQYSDVKRAVTEVPLGRSGRELLGDGAPWWEPWTGNTDLDDPFWRPYRRDGGLDHAEVPILLVGGWQDIFLDQTLEQYRRLRDRGADVALTVGPWTHLHTMTKAAPAVLRESLAWFDRHLRAQPAPPRPRTRIYVTGGGGWRELPDWPPAGTGEVVLYLEPGALTTEPGSDTAATSEFTYDPADPTPTIGGRLLSPDSGRRRDDALAGRHDVLSFTGPELTADLEAHGAPVIELDHRSDNPHFDLFVRISEVDSKGRSRNITDGFRRFVRSADDDGPIRFPLDEIAHVFRAGTRIRVLIAGGSHPRYARNLGTDEHPRDGVTMRPSTRVIGHGGRSRLILPVLDRAAESADPVSAD